MNKQYFTQPKSATYNPCWTKHPPLPISVDGNVYHVIGGSCTGHIPKVGEADVFLGFDFGMRRSELSKPWNKGVEVYFPIKDMRVPDNMAEFTQLLDWLESRILNGQKVYMGCIGGHGRTGLVMAALVTQMTGDKDSINYVRNNYCKKAVESDEQINWLHTHFGIKKAEPTKQAFHQTKKQASMNFDKYTKPKAGSPTTNRTTFVCNPVESKKNINGLNVLLK
ncbi:MAG: hypothetical protein OEX12_13580 [Gammaproteobacteria bacterium]|nr:hypothetical protein [Gammaproteobacteria bacterium]